MNMPRCLIAAIALLAISCFAMSDSYAEGGVHRLALQISDDNPQKMNTVLNVAANVARHYSSQGEEVEIRIVAFNLGLHMLREDTSPVKDRLLSFSESMPNVTFNACNNTLQGMAKKEGKEPPLVSNAIVVPAGAITLMELHEAGWTVLRP
jgi:intracellular sulfur oxidation DsrE/DsrF family protein